MNWGPLFILKPRFLDPGDLISWGGTEEKPEHVAFINPGKGASLLGIGEHGKIFEWEESPKSIVSRDEENAI